MTPMPVSKAVVLHLAPGLATVAAFAPAAQWFERAGLPAVWGMFVAVLLVLVPSEVFLMRKAAADLRWPPPRRLALMLPAALAAAMLAPGLVQWLEPLLRKTIQPALPSWWRLDPVPHGDAPAWQVAVTLAGWVLCFVVVGPIVEELYFRGFLLPRLPARAAIAVPANAMMFALYHFWQPSAWLTVAVFALPLAIVALRPRGLVVACAVHCLVNLVALLVMLQGQLIR
jgi:uncharacterized protein